MNAALTSAELVRQLQGCPGGQGEEKEEEEEGALLGGAGMALCGHAPWPSLSGADCVTLTFQKAENAEGLDACDRT